MALQQWQIDYYNAQKLRIEAEIALLDAALLALATNPTQQYSLSTGQTVQQVTKASVPALTAWRDRLDARLFDILGYLNQVDGRSVYVRPGF